MTITVTRQERAYLIDDLTEEFLFISDTESIHTRTLLQNELNKLTLAAKDINIVSNITMQNARYQGSEDEIAAQLKRFEQQWILSSDKESLMDERFLPQIRQTLDEIITTENDSKFFLITDERGALVATSELRNIYLLTREPWWNSNILNGHSHISELSFSDLNSLPFIVISTPVLAIDGKPIGALHGVYPYLEFTNHVLHQPFGETGQVWLITEEYAIAAAGSG